MQKKQKIKGHRKIAFLLGTVGKIQKAKLDIVAKNAKKAQEKTLRGILEYAKDTEWGKSHNYAEILNAKNATIRDMWA